MEKILFFELFQTIDFYYFAGLCQYKNQLYKNIDTKVKFQKIQISRRLTRLLIMRQLFRQSTIRAH